MNRFFFEPAGDVDSTVTLDKGESHHLANVLRLPVGMEIELFDGTGNLYIGRIKTAGKRVTVRLLEKVVSDGGKKAALWLYQGDLKGKKMDVVVQKCTELGVDYFVPFTSGRSQGRLERERWERKHERWGKIITSACINWNTVPASKLTNTCFNINQAVPGVSALNISHPNNIR